MRRNFKDTPLHEVDRDLVWSCIETAGERECWPWIAARQGSGYGTLYVLGKTVLSHRVAWAISRGRSPEKGKVIRHLCDNPPCCNPTHLAEGTQADNNRDIQERARQRTYNPVVIARALVDGATADDLVNIFGMHPDTASEYVKLGAEGLIERRARQRPTSLRRIDRRTAECQGEALAFLRTGASVSEVIAKFGVSRATAFRWQAKVRDSSP